MAQLRLHLLGVPEISLDGRPAHPRRRSAVALLAYLAVTGRAHHRDVLAALLAGEADEARAQKHLSNALAELRAALGDCLVVGRETVALDRERPYWLDVDAFEHCAAAAAEGDAGAAREAAALYRGELLAGISLPDAPGFDEWLLLQREHLQEALVQALQALLDGLARRGAPREGVAVARRLLALEPWREEAHRALMALLARGGQRSAALRQFGACRRALAAELGEAPAAETRALYERLRAWPRPVPHNLPAPPWPLAGR